MKGNRGPLPLRSGVADLDDIIGGILAGDNVVWVTDQQKLFDQVEALNAGGDAGDRESPARDRA